MTDALEGRTAAVTGAAGFMGQHLVRQLLAAGARVVAVDLAPLPQELSAHPNANALCWLQGAVESESIQEAAELRQADLLFHLACSLLPSASSHAIIRDVRENLLGSLALIERMRLQGNLQRVVLSSSGGTIYGLPQTTPIDETHPLEPICSYGVTKLALEQYLHIFERVHSLTFAAVRISNPFGPGQFPRPGHGVVAAFVSAGLRHEPLEIWGDGSITRDYIFIKDVIDALILAAVHPQSLTVNVGSGEGLSLNALRRQVEACLGYPLVCQHTKAREVDVPANVLGIQRAKQVLGWQPHTSLAEGLAQTARWMRLHLSRIEN
jgi:UDP-glucose 4-epimerase